MCRTRRHPPPGLAPILRRPPRCRDALGSVHTVIANGNGDCGGRSGGVVHAWTILAVLASADSLLAQTAAAQANFAAAPVVVTSPAAYVAPSLTAPAAAPTTAATDAVNDAAASGVDTATATAPLAQPTATTATSTANASSAKRGEHRIAGSTNGRRAVADTK
jgi:hypothetical protein